VILLSVGTFQVALPDPSAAVSPIFADSQDGVQVFLQWLKPQLPTPKWGQAPIKICVVGAEPFSVQKAPYLSKPLYESQEPLHSLEPYSATFHYVESKGQIKLLPKRTLGDAAKICAQGGAR
jgi:hypothetical protein